MTDQSETGRDFDVNYYRVVEDRVKANGTKVYHYPISRQIKQKRHSASLPGHTLTPISSGLRCSVAIPTNVMQRLATLKRRV